MDSKTGASNVYRQTVGVPVDLPHLSRPGPGDSDHRSVEVPPVWVGVPHCDNSIRPYPLYPFSVLLNNPSSYSVFTTFSKGW